MPEAIGYKTLARSLGVATPTPRDELILGGAYSALVGLLVATMAAIVKWGSHAFSTEFVTTIRFAAGLGTYGIFLLIIHRAIPYRTSYPGLCSLLAAVWVGGIFCCYLAVRFIPLPDAVLLIYTSPLFAPLLNLVFLRKRESWTVWLGIVLGFAGVVIVLKPGTGILQISALIGLMSGFFFAVRQVLASYLIRTVPKEVQTFYSLAVGLIICLGLLALTGLHVTNWEKHLFPPRDWLRPWVMFPGVLLAVGTLGLFSMLQPWFTTAAYEHATVGQAGPFRYTGVIFAGFLDWLCWGQIPSLSSVLGFFFITTGGIWVITREGKK
jgi:drug/metabolite transporter (DMT)-like permease